MRTKCIICGNLKNRVVFKEFDIDILKCRECGHIFSAYQAGQHYDGYFGEKIEPDQHFWWNEAHKSMYADFFNKFVTGRRGRLLDVGCGLGYFVKEATVYKDWEAFGYEISRPAAEYAKSELGLSNIFCGKVEESGFPKANFDLITLWDVIEHIPDPDPLLSYLASILKDDGVLFAHTPNARIQLPKAKIKKFLKGMKAGEHYLEAKDHVNLYSANTLRKVLFRSGFGRAEFVHLHPIGSVAGSHNRLLKSIKNGYYHFSKALGLVTRGRINIDNLFVAARK